MKVSSQLACLAVFTLVSAMYPPQVRAQCPPGPFICVPWGGGEGTPMPAPPPPGPFMPPKIWDIRPDPKMTNKSLQELISGRTDLVPLQTEDQEKIRSEIGESLLKTIDVDKSYLLLRSNSKGVVFRGREIRQ